MKAVLVPDQLTPVTPQQVGKALRSAWETLEGVTPPNETVALLMAQSALETGRWRSIHCYNLGNVKAGPSYEGAYCQFRCNEVLGGKVVWFDPPHPQCNFRAYGSLEVGALKWLQAIKAHFPSSYTVARSGMPLAYVHQLKLERYFTADEGPYSRSVASLWNEYKRLLARDDLDTEPAPPPDDEAELHALALAAKANFDPLEAAREERRKQMGES